MREPSRELSEEDFLFYKSTRGTSFNLSLSVPQINLLLELAEKEFLLESIRPVFKALVRKGLIRQDDVISGKYLLTEAGKHVAALLSIADWQIRKEETHGS